MKKLSRRWILFAACLGIGLIFLGLAGRRAWLAWNNQRVKQWVDSYGGAWSYTFEGPGGNPPRTPEGIQRLFDGVAVLDDIDQVALSGSPAISLEEIRMLNRLPNLHILSLQVSEISDEHVEILTRNRSIRYLDLSNSGVTDAGILSIAQRLDRLGFLEIANTAITGKGLLAIGDLTGLEMLNLEGTLIGDRDLHHLRNLQNLTVLRLGERVTDAGIREITRLKKLDTLGFFRSGITDSGIEEAVRGLPELRNVYLVDTGVSDAKKKELGLTDDNPSLKR